jgi:hypothetical protein
MGAAAFYTRRIYAKNDERIEWIIMCNGSVRAATGVARKPIAEIQFEDWPRRKDGGYGWHIILEGAKEDFSNSAEQSHYIACALRTEYRYYW